jgi:hypothetical protein
MVSLVYNILLWSKQLTSNGYAQIFANAWLCETYDEVEYCCEDDNQSDDCFLRPRLR